MLDAYDEVPYSNFPHAQAHPSRVAALAAIAGLQLPPLKKWRVLEIGCGDGSNILPLAADYPEGSFVGVDRAKETVGRGRALAADLHLANLDLHAADLLDWQPEGEFDYIAALGVYSWVPPEVREKILQICERHLKPLGVAFISYNVLPGCHFRRFAWDLLRFHLRREENPIARVKKARDLARQVMSVSGEEPLQIAIRKEMEEVLERDVSALYHDDLSETNEPFYLLDFAAQASRHGLQYLGDADPLRDHVLGGMPLSEDWLDLRQYGDFLAARRFRETLLCRRGVALDRKLVLDRFRDLFAASRAKPEEVKEDGEQQFTLPNSRSVATNHPFAKDLLCKLSAIWPASLRISEFPLDKFPADNLANLLMRLLQPGMIELRTNPPKIAASVGDRPLVSALARAQLAQGSSMVTNQRHQNVRFEDAIGRKLLLMMDGSRDRAALARELAILDPNRTSIEHLLEAALLDFHRMNLLKA